MYVNYDDLQSSSPQPQSPMCCDCRYAVFYLWYVRFFTCLFCRMNTANTMLLTPTQPSLLHIPTVLSLSSLQRSAWGCSNRTATALQSWESRCEPQQPASNLRAVGKAHSPIQPWSSGSLSMWKPPRTICSTRKNNTINLCLQIIISLEKTAKKITQYKYRKDTNFRMKKKILYLSAHNGLKYPEYTRNIKVMVCILSVLFINVAGRTKCFQLTVTDLEIKR